MSAEQRGAILGALGVVRVSDETPPASRVKALEQLADQGATLDQVKALAAGFTGDARLRAEQVLAAAQALGWHADPPGEWFQPVLATLAVGGDCEDLAAALVALARAAGLRARIAWLDQPEYPQNHVTAQISFDPMSVPGSQATWLWAEPSVDGAALGEDPYVAANARSALVRLRGNTLKTVRG